MVGVGSQTNKIPKGILEAAGKTGYTDDMTALTVCIVSVYLTAQNQPFSLADFYHMLRGCRPHNMPGEATYPRPVLKTGLACRYAHISKQACSFARDLYRRC